MVRQLQYEYFSLEIVCQARAIDAQVQLKGVLERLCEGVGRVLEAGLRRNSHCRTAAVACCVGGSKPRTISRICSRA